MFFKHKELNFRRILASCNLRRISKFRFYNSNTAIFFILTIY
ncbi:hypothetical protein HMPREF9554_01139 [Treponema phagedenis F0421]|nr:hypothetical protein HMPREF9554_01139 [Treponema phagedenis F0421]